MGAAAFPSRRAATIRLLSPLGAVLICLLTRQGTQVSFPLPWKCFHGMPSGYMLCRALLIRAPAPPKISAFGSPFRQYVVSSSFIQTQSPLPSTRFTPEPVDELLHVLALSVLRLCRLAGIPEALRHGLFKHSVVALEEESAAVTGSQGRG